ncbi:MAG: hypothetical protein U0002_17500 [Thermoanaerobaculia bacterium]
MKAPAMRGAAVAWVMAAGLFGVARPAAADLEDALAERWRDRFVVVSTEVVSGCDGGYTNNELAGRRVVSRAAEHFAPGELGRVHKVEVKRNRLEVLVDLVEGLLEPFDDGPFHLFEQKSCKVELLIEVPREAIKGRDVEALDRLLVGYLERYPSEQDARGAKSWNRRRQPPLPRDYERTRAEYEEWKRRQLAARVGSALDRALGELAEVRERMRIDDEYLEGFAAGLIEQRHLTFYDCDDALRANFYGCKRSPPSLHDRDRDWVKGFDDGQLTAFDLEIVRRLRSCLPPPPESR